MRYYNKMLNCVSMKTVMFISTLLWCFAAQAGLLLNYSQLALKDLDQMSKLIQSKISESRKVGGDQVIPLKECLQAVFARPNEDFMIEKIISPLKSELEGHNAWESSITALVKEANGALKNPKPFKPVVLVTYAIFLENLIAEIKPKVGETFEAKILKQIQDAKIEIPKAAQNERRLRMMKELSSPSDVAREILENHAEAEKERLKAEAEAAKKGTNKKEQAPQVEPESAENSEE